MPMKRRMAGTSGARGFTPASMAPRPCIASVSQPVGAPG